MKKYVSLIFVKIVYKKFSGLQKYREKIAVKITKRKALMEQACRAASSLHPKELKGRPA